MKRTLAYLPLLALAAACSGDQSNPLAAPAAPAAAAAGRYIVVLKSGTFHGPRASISASVSRVAGERAVRPDYVYSTVLQGFAAPLTQAQLAALRADPRVAYVEADQPMYATTTQTGATWGIDRIDQRNLPLSGTYTYTADGSGVNAYIIDTGIRFSHAEFGGRATSGFDAVDGGSADDCNGHGTHVAGTVGGSTYGVAKNVHLVAVRVLDCGGSGTTAGVISGVDWVTANHVSPAVANMSLGGGASTTLDNAVASSIASGVTYAIAAGNGNFLGIAVNACNTSPARVATAITVGATDQTDKKASWSNYGSCLDLFAPGVNITSSWYSNDTATNTISGTSMATPHVVGVAALYLQGNPSATPSAVAGALVANATTGKVTSPGTGSPNRLLFENY
ncbi:MAG TPA: S8 family peptidase [Longimicrobiaceae bacterium]|nr:S8 family peptidase [Longimicrobiaceae bacterium]